MNPHQNSNQTPAAASEIQQVNSGGLFPNNRPIAAPPCFMNFPNQQPFPIQNAPVQFPNGINGFNPQQNYNSFPVNQFNPSQQQGQFFANNSMNRPVYNQNVGLPNPQAIMQNTIQNICQLLQLQNPNYAQCPPGNFPMFQNQMNNVMSQQNMGFLPNQQFGMPNYCGPLLPNMQQMPNMGQQLPGNMFLPNASGPVQTQQLQNQIGQGVVPQNQSFLPNQVVGSGPMQHGNQGQQRPMMDANASRQIPNTGQQPLPQNPPDFQEKNENGPATVKAGWVSPHKNFTGDRKNDVSHSYRGFKSQFPDAKQGYNRNNKIHVNKEGKNNAPVDPRPRNPTTNFEKKSVPSLKYTDREIKQWREARKKHHPSNVHKSKDEETSILRRQQLKEILAKQAELGVEVAEIPSYYLSENHESGQQKQFSKTEKYERDRFRKGKFNNKRGPPFQNDRINKRRRPENHNPKKSNEPKRDPSLLQKLLMRDIKRDQNHLLQVFRFMAVNSFFSGDPNKSLKFPAVIVGPDVTGDVAGESNCSVVEGGEKAVVEVDVESEEEEGEITD